MSFPEQLFTSRSEEWETPQALFDTLDREFDFTLDPCATKENTKCERFYTIEDDGLVQDWIGERVFMNPPYGRNISQWMQKLATSECQLGVALVHARTDTRWWHDWVEPYADEIRFIKGRVKFSAQGSSTFPSVLVIYRRAWAEHQWGIPVTSVGLQRV